MAMSRTRPRGDRRGRCRCTGRRTARPRRAGRSPRASPRRRDVRGCRGVQRCGSSSRHTRRISVMGTSCHGLVTGSAVRSIGIVPAIRAPPSVQPGRSARPVRPACQRRPGHRVPGHHTSSNAGCSPRRPGACGGRPPRLGERVAVATGAGTTHHAAHGVPQRAIRATAASARFRHDVSASTARPSSRTMHRAADGAPDAIPLGRTPIRDTFLQRSARGMAATRHPRCQVDCERRPFGVIGELTAGELDAAHQVPTFGWCAAISRRPCGISLACPAGGAACTGPVRCPGSRARGGRGSRPRRQRR